MEDNKKIEEVRKVSDLLKHYKKEGTEIVLQNRENKKLKIKGTVEVQGIVSSFFGFRPSVFINGMKIFLEDIDPASIYPADVEVDEGVVEGPGRKSIPKSLKFEVWERFFGDKLRGKCLCCKSVEIARDDCEMCHIISVASGGDTNIDNLKPGCKNCNRSMGTMDFEEYRRRYH